jgi:hypothetical protein
VGWIATRGFSANQNHFARWNQDAARETNRGTL